MTAETIIPDVASYTRIVVPVLIGAPEAVIVKRDLIVADTTANGRAYARERHIRKPLIITMEPALRGAMLSCFRLHMVNEADWRPGVMKTLLICADGEPLNSFLADN